MNSLAHLNRFDDKVAVITGAASGIGRATAVRLAAEGASVACLDVNGDGLRETCDAIAEADGHSMSLLCDIGDEDSVSSAIKQVIERYDRINVLCNIAGILRADHSHELSLADWNKVIAIPWCRGQVTPNDIRKSVHNLVWILAHNIRAGIHFF